MKKLLVCLLLSLLFLKIAANNRIPSSTLIYAAKKIMGAYHSNVNTDKNVICSQLLPNSDLFIVQFSEGWIMLSADKRCTPVFALSDKGVFSNYDALPPQVKYLIEKYKEEIERQKNIKLERWFAS